MQTPVDITYLADAVVLLRYYEAKGKLNKAVSVVKKRSGSHEHAIRELIISDGKVSVGQALQEYHGVLTGVPWESPQY
jgi:circadian clock protein KaiC